jgi:hypothetical protein
MLERISRFVLEVLPYLLTALIAAVLVPGFLLSQAHGTKSTVMSNITYRQNVLEIRLDGGVLQDWILSDSRP